MAVNLYEINKNEALRYMGCGNKKPDEKTWQQVLECEKKLLENIRCDYVFRVFDINETDKGISVNGTSLILSGNDIKNHLKGCEKVALFVATIGIGADKLIRYYSAVDMACSVITDCLASAAVEQVCDMADAEIKKQLSLYNQTWRFSAGYGDLPLEIQKDFLDILDAEKRIGVTCLDNFMMTPTKSVTAIVGLSKEEIISSRRGCSCCKMKDICQFRKRGDHCGGI